MGLGIINPIRKKGHFIQPDNYRKISVLNIVGKLFEITCICCTPDSIICDKQPAKEDPFQYDLRMATVALITFCIKWNHWKDNALHKSLYICYIDFKSTFDFVNRHALLLKVLNRVFQR